MGKRKGGQGSGGKKGGGGKQKTSTARAQEGGVRHAKRKEQRHQAKQQQKQKQKGKMNHGSEDAKEEVRERLRAKAMERKLTRLSETAPAAERASVLLQLGQLHMRNSKQKPAIAAFRQLLELQPEDPEFARVPLLCAFMDRAQTMEASDLLKGPLYQPILGSIVLGSSPPASGGGVALVDSKNNAARVAAATGSYSLALLRYISTIVLEEHGLDPNKAAAAENRLSDSLQDAKKRNPFVAEYLAFEPAFEPHFPAEMELPKLEDCKPEELPLRDALEYCCHYRQAGVWMDTDENVRRFLRCNLFEEDEPDEGAQGQEEPPFGKLPDPAVQEPPLIARWRKAREAALELWASEMSVEGGSDEEGEEEEEEDEGEESEEEDEDGEEVSKSKTSKKRKQSSNVMADLESRLQMG